MKFVQHLPDFCDFEPYSFEFDTLEQLLQDERIRHYMDAKEFYRFSLGSDPMPMLMIELDEGYRWYCLGYIYHAVEAEINKLPGWHRKYHVPPEAAND